MDQAERAARPIHVLATSGTRMRSSDGLAVALIEERGFRNLGAALDRFGTEMRLPEG